MFAGRRTFIIFKTDFPKNSVSLMCTLFTVLCGLSVIRVRRLRRHVVPVKTVIWKMNGFGIKNVNCPHFKCEECVIKLCAIIIWENQGSSFLEDLYCAI
jgi:hypothetical protein